MKRRALILACAGAILGMVPGQGHAQVIADARFEKLVADVRAEMLANPDEALRNAKEAERLAGKASSLQQRGLRHATALWLIGEAYTRTGQNRLAGPVLEQALRKIDPIAPRGKLKGDILLSRGSNRAALGGVADALADFQAAHSIFGTIGEARSEARALTQIAALYFSGNDYANALKYYSEAMDAYQGDPGLLVAIYNGRGNALRELGRLSAAQREYSSALMLARQMKSPMLTATILANISRSLLADHQLSQADETIREAMTITATGEASSFRPVILGIAAQAAVERRDIPAAHGLIERRFAGVALDRTTLVDRDAHETAYTIYMALGQTGPAVGHLAALKRLDDEATALVRSTNAALMAARFDFANQELRITRLRASDLQKTVAYERTRVATQRMVFIGIAGATLLIMAMLGFALVTIFRSRNKVRSANTDLALTNTALGKALAAKTEFLATTSHEIRTPLNGILGMTQVMLADPGLDDATRDRVEVVHGAGVTMRALVDDILDVAKIETGNLSIEAVPFDVRQTIVDAARMWRDQAEAKGLAFTIMLDACPGRIVGDPPRLRQIVFNLLSNAVKFTAAGSIDLSCTRSEDGRYRIMVRDTGIGIAPGHHEEIFESFRQADAGTTRLFGGTGLGLSICRSLSRAMGGDVMVASEYGAGAIFTLDLPLIAAELDDAVPLRASSDPPGLLIVDRNPISRSMFKALLEPRGGAATLVSTIEEAIAAMAKGRFATVMVDDATARAGGDHPDALTRLVQAGRDSGATIAVLWPAMTDIERAELLRTGIDRLIAKPIAKDALVRTIFDEPSRIEAEVLVSRAA